MLKFFERVDADPNWFPGKKRDDDQRGRPTELTKKKRNAVAKSMMAAKKRGETPCYELAVALCPTATFNESTQKTFSRRSINEVLTTDCYDEDPGVPWEFRFGPQRRALTAEAMENRVAWGTRLLKEVSDGKNADWFCRNIVWIGLCSKVIPGSPQKALDQQQAARNKKLRLMSPNATTKSMNMGGSATAETQASYGDTRVYYGVVLCRGVLGATVFTDVGDFPGETPLGIRYFIERLPALLQTMLGCDTPKPRTIFSDRGPGFYHKCTGYITGE